LKLTYDESLSKFAFNFNLRRYSLGGEAEMENMTLSPGELGGAVQVDPGLTALEFRD
jgi:hypothetical protein